MALTSPTLEELQACRDSLNLMYVNGIMSKGAWSLALGKLESAIDEKILTITREH